MKVVVSGCPCASYTSFSQNAPPSPWATPPWICPSTISGLSTRPQSWTITYRWRLSAPVSGSISTMQAWTPLLNVPRRGAHGDGPGRPPHGAGPGWGERGQIALAVCPAPCRGEPLAGRVDGDAAAFVGADAGALEIAGDAQPQIPARRSVGFLLGPPVR